jgi:hypothetical protein
MKMNKRICRWASLAVLMVLAACASLGPRDIALSQADLQALLARQFPKQQRVFELIDVSMTQPVVRLAPERNRIVTELDLSAAERITGRTVKGNLSLDHSLRYEPTDGTVRLTNLKVNDMKLDVGGTPLAGQMARLSTLLTERLLDDFVIYRVSDDKRAALQRAGADKADIAVTSRGVEINFAPAK